MFLLNFNSSILEEWNFNNKKDAPVSNFMDLHPFRSIRSPFRVIVPSYTHLLASGRKFAADKTENGPEISIVLPLNALVQFYSLVRTLYEILNSRAQSVLRTSFEYVCKAMYWISISLFYRELLPSFTVFNENEM